jgi:UDP-glucose 4-epimerase
MKVLVTGGAGYIGSHTARALVERNHEVVILDSLELGHRALAERSGATRLVVGNIGDAGLVGNLLSQEKPDAVMHFAAYKAPGESVENPAKYFHNNVANTMSLLDTMREHDVPRFIFSSTSAIFGQPELIPVTETNNPFNPESPYGESKLMVEKILKWYDQAYGLKSICLRYFNAAGASLDGQLGEDWSMTLNLIPLVMKVALGKSKSIKVFGSDYPTRDGTCIRDYIHVVDLARAHVLALEYLAEHNQSTAYNLGTGQGSTVNEVIEATKRISGTNFPVEYIGRRPGDPAALWADSSKAQAELGWSNRYDLDTIIQTAYNWHKTHLDGI